MYLKINETKNHFQLKTFAILCAIACAICFAFGVQSQVLANEESDSSGDTTCKATPAIEEMFRLGLTPSLNMTEGEGLATSLSMTGGGGLDTQLTMSEGDGFVTSLSMTERDDALTQATTARITMYRLYNKYTGEHFYTSNATEKNNLVKASWTYEGVGWYAPKTSKTPVYRLYNPYVSGGDHHYTTNSSERSTLKNAGWKDEGVGWYSTDVGEVDRVPLYRQYNPFAQTGTHNYTQSKSENDKLIKAGWKEEGTGWYGYSKSTPTIQALDFSKISVSTTAKTYNGKAQTQTVKSSAYKLNTDYTVTYSNNKNAGTATIVVKGKGNYTGSKSYKFTINKLNISNATVTLGTALTYNTNEQTQSIKSVKVGSLTLSTSDYTVSNNKATNAGSNYALTVTGKGNFTGTATKTFTIAKAIPVCVAPTGLTGYVGDTLSTVDIASETVTGNTPGAFTWAGGTQTMSEAGEKEFTATFKPSDIKNYETVDNIAVKVSVENRYKGYWLGTKGAGTEFVDEAYFAKNDSNYVSGKDISADMKVLHDSTNVNYTTVKAKWDKYYSDDNVRLYATYEGGENETAYDGTTTSEKNKYVEFRILEVSGADGHKLHDGTTSDGSAVTFMATHVLPTAYQMNTENNNEGGWGACQLCKDMNKIGETEGKIYSKFSDDFVSSVKAVTKEYNAGNKAAQGAIPSTVDCQFWVPSYTELVSSTASDYPGHLPKLEGTQYDWCTINVTNATAGNFCLIYTTRGGATPSSCRYSTCYWWDRSPYVGSTYSFGYVNYAGYPYYYNYANFCLGVAPAFSF